MEESAQLNILIETGTDFVLPFTIYDNNGIPLDLTGATVVAQLREYAEASDYFDFSCMHNGTGGRITITMINETTSLIPYTHGVYDVQVTLADGTVSYPLSGDVTIREGVTMSFDGSVLFMLGINSFEDLPEVGNVDRLYFTYDDRRIYRWNGTNYIATAVGNGIRNIRLKSHVDVYTDIYTIVYDDGTTWDYTVTTKGVYSVSKIGSTGTVVTGVVDQYRMTFNDSTYVDYCVTNGRTFNVVGGHDSEQSYSYMDMVRSSGATYIAKQNVPANTEITDTTYWQLILAPFTLGTVESVGYDANPEITVTGTPDAPVLNFKVPRGIPGNESINDAKGHGDTDYVWSADKSKEMQEDMIRVNTGTPEEITVTFTANNQYIQTSYWLTEGMTYMVNLVTSPGKNIFFYDKRKASGTYISIGGPLALGKKLTAVKSGYMYAYNRSSNCYIGSVTFSVCPLTAAENLRAVHGFNGMISTDRFASLNDIWENGFWLVPSQYGGVTGRGLPPVFERNGFAFNLITAVVSNIDKTKASGDYRFQIAFEPNYGMYFRKTSTNVWGAWVSVGNICNTPVQDLDNPTNDERGIISVNSATLNSPVRYASTGIIYRQSDTIKSEFIFDSRDGRIFFRKYLTDQWLPWNVIYANDKNIAYVFDFDKETVPDTWEEEWQEKESYLGRPNLIASNTGINLNVCSYNVGAYRYNGSKAYISTLPEKILNLRTWVMDTDADTVLMQEDAAYIDANSTKSSSSYFWYDKYPAKAKRPEGGSGVKIRSKYPLIQSSNPRPLIKTIMDTYKDKNGNVVSNPGARAFVWAYQKIAGKNILFISAHLRNTGSIYFDSDPTNGPVQDRKNSMQIIFDLIFCLHDERILSNIDPYITEPWDYVIFGGDFNTSNKNGRYYPSGAYIDAGTDDWDNLAELRNYYGFESANGGFLNWFVTYPSRYALENEPLYTGLDNILVSGNVMINKVKCRPALLDNLYSDHLPLEANVTLLDPTANPDYGDRFPDTTYEGKSVANNLSELRQWYSDLLTNGNVQYPCV